MASERTSEHLPPEPPTPSPDGRGSDGAGRRARWDADRRVAWAVGLVAGFVVLGPGLAPGGLYRLDLVVPDRTPTPRGVWGLGPELPRRVPTWLPMAWLGDLVGAPLVTKVVIVASVATAVAGAWRLAAAGGRLAGLTSGLAYGIGPFVLTRLGVGHLMVVVTAAVLPWALDDLLHPARRLSRTFLWGAAMAAGGFFGGGAVVAVVGVGLVADRGHKALRVVAVTVASQACWLAPSVVVALTADGADLSGGTAFATQGRGVLGVGWVLAGHGFWQPPLQIGWPDYYDLPGPVGWLVAAFGVVLAGCAVAGSTRTAVAGRRAAALAGVGFVVAMASATPLVDGLWSTFTATTVGSPLREGQRYLLLYLVWAAPSAAVGAARIADRFDRHAGSAAGAGAAVTRVAPLSVALVLAGPGLWGVDGALAPRDLPDEWAQVRAVVHAEPGPVVALPWELYLDVPFEGGERGRLLNPLPLYLGGDVITASDPHLGGTTRERADPREPAIDLLTYDLRSDVTGDEVPPRFGAGVAGLGVRWVVVVEGGDADRYATVAEDPDLTPVLVLETISLWEVHGWPGAVTEGAATFPGGEPVAQRRVLPPVTRVEASGVAVWRQPAVTGWLRGLEPAGRTPEGLVLLPAGRGVVWYWPSLVVIAAHAGWVAAIIVTLFTRRERGQPPVNRSSEGVETGMLAVKTPRVYRSGIRWQVPPGASRPGGEAFWQQQRGVQQ